MQIEKRTLYIAIPILLVLLISSIIAYSIYQREKAKERDQAEYTAYFEKVVDREYKSLLSEYNSIIETINDYEYSYEFRRKYVVKLNKLLDENRYEYSYLESETVAKCISTHKSKKEGDLKILKQLARSKAFNKVWGIE